MGKSSQENRWNDFPIKYILGPGHEHSDVLLVANLHLLMHSDHEKGAFPLPAVDGSRKLEFQVMSGILSDTYLGR